MIDGLCDEWEANDNGGCLPERPINCFSAHPQNLLTTCWDNFSYRIMRKFFSVGKIVNCAERIDDKVGKSIKLLHNDDESVVMKLNDSVGLTM